jgi:NADH kinase
LNNEEISYQVSLEHALSDYKNIKPFKENIGQNLHFTETPESDNFELVITIGGDGTILWAHKLLNKEELPPFVCFDGGSLCFLSNFSMKNC